MLVRNAYGKTMVNVAGVSIPPLQTRDIDSSAWNSWMEHSGNQETAAKYLALVTDGGEGVDVQLPQRNVEQLPVDSAVQGVVVTELSGDNSAARQQAIDAAVAALMEGGGPDELTQQGNPRLPAVKQRTGLTDVTAEEVTAAVVRYNEQREAESAAQQQAGDEGSGDDQQQS